MLPDYEGAAWPREVSTPVARLRGPDALEQRALGLR